MQKLSVILAAVFVLAGVGTVQVFIPPGNYGGQYGYVVRECTIDTPDGGWGEREDVLVKIELYDRDGEQVGWDRICTATGLHAVITYRDMPSFDSDGDGDVDLADFAEFARQMGSDPGAPQ